MLLVLLSVLGQSPARCASIQNEGTRKIRVPRPLYLRDRTGTLGNHYVWNARDTLGHSHVLRAFVSDNIWLLHDFASNRHYFFLQLCECVCVCVCVRSHRAALSTLAMKMETTILGLIMLAIRQRSVISETFTWRDGWLVCQIKACNWNT